MNPEFPPLPKISIADAITLIATRFAIETGRQLDSITLDKDTYEDMMFDLKIACQFGNTSDGRRWVTIRGLRVECAE